MSFISGNYGVTWRYHSCLGCNTSWSSLASIPQVLFISASLGVYPHKVLFLTSPHSLPLVAASRKLFKLRTNHITEKKHMCSTRTRATKIKKSKSTYKYIRRHRLEHREVVQTGLGETVLQYFTGSSHPLPPPVGINRGIGLQTYSAPGELDDDACDIPSVLIYVRAVNTMVGQTRYMVFTDIDPTV